MGTYYLHKNSPSKLDDIHTNNDLFGDEKGGYYLVEYSRIVGKLLLFMEEFVLQEAMQEEVEIICAPAIYVDALLSIY